MKHTNTSLFHPHIVLELKPCNAHPNPNNLVSSTSRSTITWRSPTLLYCATMRPLTHACGSWCCSSSTGPSDAASTTPTQGRSAAMLTAYWPSLTCSSGRPQCCLCCRRGHPPNSKPLVSTCAIAAVLINSH